ncbi:heat shock protein 70 family [Flagelloscypha sp. PMI_526]|nr:heat shock protein 70 family [Flagelloscypha sp. PMI_526]
MPNLAVVEPSPARSSLSPHTSNVSQRQATRDAGATVGLNALYIINEPAAAVVAYGLDEKISGKRNALIFDLGGGSFDVSLLTIEESVFEVNATPDLHNCLVNCFVREFKCKHNKDPSNPCALCRLRTTCERAKHTSSSAAQLLFKSTLFLEGVDFYTSLTRACFKDLCQDLFRSTLNPAEKVFRMSKISKSNVYEIVLIGGYICILCIVTLVSNSFNGKEPIKFINPDEAIAFGAAIQAAILSGDIFTFSMCSLFPLVEAAGCIMTALIKEVGVVEITKGKLYYHAKPSILGQDRQSNHLTGAEREIC